MLPPLAYIQVVVFTGSLRPERFQESDAAFNVGMAVGALATLTAGVFVVMSGGVRGV